MDRFDLTNPQLQQICPKTGKPIHRPRLSGWAKLLFPLIGAVSLLWFLVRVLPKPSRASYPCQRAVAPLASSFVIWLLGTGGCALAFRNAQQKLKTARFVLAGLLLVVGVLASLVAVVGGPGRFAHANSNIPYSWQPSWVRTDPVNTPMGVAKGIHPGRVAWVQDFNSTSGDIAWDNSIDGSNPSGYFWDENHCHQAVVNDMVGKAICWMTGESTEAAAWDAIFRYYNRNHGKGDIGYQPGEKIAIKLNASSAFPATWPGYSSDPERSYMMTNPDDPANAAIYHLSNNESNPTPQMTIALLHQLVDVAGVPQQDIYVGDPIRFWLDPFYNRCHAAYPNVHYMDPLGQSGRERVQLTSQSVLFYSGPASAVTDQMSKFIYDSDYFINLALLKRSGPIGGTLCGKNTFGVMGRSPEHLHDWLHGPNGWATGMGTYHVLVDHMGSKQLGGKTLLYMLDGLFGGWWSNTAWSMPVKWDSLGGKWPSSVFVSQDPVAIDSVGLDVLHSETTDLADCADNYMHEAAQANNPPSGTFYDPDQSGTRLPSLGVHEHWNNDTAKKYSRNLGTGNGIELVTTPPTTLSVLPTTILRGQNGDVQVQINAQGTENAIGFSLNFDPAQLQYVSAQLGSSASSASLLVNANNAAQGRVGFGMMLPLNSPPTPPSTFPAGTSTILKVTFKALAGTSTVNSPITFGDSPVVRQVADGNAVALPDAYADSTVTVKSTNNPPTVDNQSVTTNQDTPLPITLTGSDIDGNTLTFSVATNPTHGSLTGTAPNLTYTPNAGYHGSDSFTFKAYDGTVYSTPGTVTITVNGKPTANAKSVSCNQDTAVAIALTGSDPENDPLTYTITGGPSHGQLTGTPPNLTYTPAPGYTGSDSFTFKVNDGHQDSASATVSITVNAKPTANVQNVNVLQDVAKAVTLTGSDPENATLTYAVVTNPAHGKLTGTAPSLTYTPNTGYYGPDSFTFKVNDGKMDSDPAMVSITVNGKPSGTVQNVTTNQDTAVAITLTGSDPENDPLSFATVTNPAHGTLTGTAPNLTYTPNAGYHGTDNFTFKVNDGKQDSAVATVTIAVNGKPTANANNVTCGQDTALAITLTGSDPENDPLTFTTVSGPSHGQLSGTAPNLTYTPNAGYIGPDSFTFKVNDGRLDSSAATVSITVNGKPVANAQSVTALQDKANTVTLTGSDPENASLTYVVVANPTHGKLTGTAPSLTYTPDAGYYGADSFTFKVNDGKMDSDPATVSISVNGKPVANAQNVATGQDTPLAITLTGSDPENDPLTFLAAKPSHGTLSGTAPNLTYTPAAGYHGSDSFNFTVNDGKQDSDQATVSITIQAKPTANGQTISINQDTAVAVTLTGSDPENATLTYAIVTNPAHGNLTGTAPNLTYTPNAGYHGTDSFTFKVSNSQIDSAPATISININGKPTADAQNVKLNQDTATTIHLTGSDPENTTLTFSMVSYPVNGKITGTMPNPIYTPNAGYHGPDSFTFKVSDGKMYADPATVSITVNGKPTADKLNVKTNQNTAVAITLTGSDPDNDPLTFVTVTNPAHGTLAGTAPNLTYTPASGFHGTDSFTFKANDGSMDSAVATVSITVNGKPTASSQTVNALLNTALPITLTGTDPENDPLTFTVVNNPAHGTLSGTAPDLTYTPADGYVGTDSFTFTVNDGSLDSDPATVSINVGGKLIALAQSVITNQNTALPIVLSCAGAQGTTLKYSIVTKPVHGSLSGTAPNLKYTPASNYHGADSFTFTVNDGKGVSDPAMISITVNGKPTVTGQAVTLNQDTPTAITLAGSDPENDPLTYVIVTNPAHGTLSGIAPTLTYTPAAGYRGADKFTFKVNDGRMDSATATVTLTVIGKPTAKSQSVVTNQDIILPITLSGTDPSLRKLTYRLVDVPAHGTLTGNAPKVTYTPAAGYVGPDSFTFVVNNGYMDSNLGTVTIKVNGQPTANSQDITTDQNTPIAVVLTGSDPNGDTLTYTLVAKPTHGTLTGTAPNLTYKPTTGYYGSDKFTFKVSDGRLSSTTVTVNITVVPIHGLQGQYFGNIDLTNPLLTRIDNTLNFNWGSGTPNTIVPKDNFSVRWTGQIQPLYSETYKFYLKSSGGVRLLINGQPVIDDWTVNNTERAASIALTAGQRYDIVVEYYVNTALAQVALSWSSQHQVKQVVPTNQLFLP